MPFIEFISEFLLKISPRIVIVKAENEGFCRHDFIKFCQEKPVIIGT